VEFEKVSYDNYIDLIFALEKLYKKKIELITNGNLSPYILPYVEKEVIWYERR
jgi:predicted nucleotidyltransferase